MSCGSEALIKIAIDGSAKVISGRVKTTITAAQFVSHFPFPSERELLRMFIELPDKKAISRSVSVDRVVWASEGRAGSFDSWFIDCNNSKSCKSNLNKFMVKSLRSVTAKKKAFFCTSSGWWWMWSLHTFPSSWCSLWSMNETHKSDVISVIFVFAFAAASPNNFLYLNHNSQQ